MKEELVNAVISMRREARDAVAEEVRLEAWKMPSKQAERLEAYEARLQHHMRLLMDQISLATGAGAITPPAPTVPTEQKTAEPQKLPGRPSDPDQVPDAPDLSDELEDGDGGDLF